MRRGSLLAAALLMLPATALAWEPMRTADGRTELRWPDTHARVATCGGGLDAAEQLALWQALGVWWREAGLRLVLEPVVRADCALDFSDTTTAIERVVDAQGWSDAWGPATSVIGFTVHTHDAAGRLSDADIVLNDAHFALSSTPDDGAVDLGWLVAHELGHVLGVGHPCGESGGAHTSCFDLPADEAALLTGALMFPSAATGAREAHLGDDDRAALGALHGATDAPPAPRACLDAAGDAVRFEAGEPGSLTGMRWIDAERGAGPLLEPTPTLAAGGRPGLLQVVRDDGTSWLGALTHCADAPDPAPDTLDALEPDAPGGDALGPPDAGPRGDGGCGCALSTPRRTRAMLLGWLALALGSLWLRRRLAAPPDAHAEHDDHAPTR